MHSRIRTIALPLIAVAVFATEGRGQSVTTREPIARVGDKSIFDEDLLPSIGGQLFQLKNQEYELKSKELQRLVSQELLASAAKKSGLSVEAFLVQTVDRNVQPPTAGEVEAYYLAQKDQIGRPLSEVKTDMEQALMEAKRQQARQRYIDGLQDNADVAVLLRQPRIEVDPDPSRLRGNPGAPVTIVEFSDFQCPYCRAAEPGIREVLDKYKDKVRFGYRDFPLRAVHPQAQQAAEASRCAGEQGKFWEYHDVLYANQANLDEVGLTEHAHKVGLNMDLFSSCLASRKFESGIESDFQSGLKAGVSGTPAFYINGVVLSGSQPPSAFERVIQSELKLAESKSAGH